MYNVHMMRGDFHSWSNIQYFYMLRDSATPTYARNIVTDGYVCLPHVDTVSTVIAALIERLACSQVFDVQYSYCLQQ